MDGGNAGFAGAKTGPEPRCKEKCLLTNLSGPRSSWLLASLALRASLRLLLPLVVASFTKANDAYAAKGETSGILPFALRASLRLFNFVPTKLSMPLATRLESSKRCYWLCQTSGWPEWAVTTPAASPATFNSVRYAHKSQKARKPESQKARKQKNDFRPQAAKIYSDCCGFSRPNRASPQVKKYGSHARMIPCKDRGSGRALRSVGLTGFF